QVAVADLRQDEVGFARTAVDDGNLIADRDEVDVVVHRPNRDLRDLGWADRLDPTNFRQLAGGSARNREALRRTRLTVTEQLGRLRHELIDRPAVALGDRVDDVVLLDELHLATGDDEALTGDVLRLL